MTPNHRPGRMTRRGFLGRGAGALATAGLLQGPHSASAMQEAEEKGRAKSDSLLPTKIALEEHFVISETADASYGSSRNVQFRATLEEIGQKRIAEMDRGGVEFCILSLVGPGIQGIPKVSDAIAIARRANDHLAESIAKNPRRFKGFAALAMQDPQAAAEELTRCVKQLGFCGALVNGFSEIEGAGAPAFYDLPQYRPFWATVQELGVAFYLHPRSPLPKEPAYQGHEWLTGSVWGFTAETSVHALRLMGSGLFDEYPKLTVILGHLGEGLPCNIWRIDNRIKRTFGGHPKSRMPMSHYLRNNFFITTSGNFRTQTLSEVMLEVGSERLLYSVDYPFEDMGEAASWFDTAAISEADRMRIARSNASRLFRIESA